MYIIFQLKECNFWTKVAHRISTFSCLSEVTQIPHVIFETRSHIVKCKWNFLETLIQSVQGCLSRLFQCTLFLMFPLFQKYFNPKVQNQQNGKQCCLPLLFFKISLLDASFHISLNSLGFLSLSRMLVEFSLTYLFHHVSERFLNLWCSHSQKMH